MAYDPFFFNIYKKQLIPPVFSLALSRPTRGISDGYLALGGLPPVSSTGPWATQPLEYVAIGPGYINGSLPYPQYREPHPLSRFA